MGGTAGEPANPRLPQRVGVPSGTPPGADAAKWLTKRNMGITRVGAGATIEGAASRALKQASSWAGLLRQFIESGV